MSEEGIPENIREKIDFVAWTKKGEEEEMWRLLKNRVEQRRRTIEKKGKKHGYKLYELAPEESEFLSNMIVNAEQKLKVLDIEKAHELIPQLEQIIIVEFDPYHREQRYFPKNRPRGSHDLLGTYLEVRLPQGMKITHPEAQHVFYHEVSHLIPRRVIKRNPFSISKEDRIVLRARGFTRSLGLFGDAEAGVWEEPLAELYALFCQNKNLEIATGYAVETAFMLAFIKKFADKKDNLTPFEAFKLVYRGNALRDFIVQKELVEVFGPQLVRELNDAVPGGTPVILEEYYSQFAEIAHMGGFYDRYNSLKQTLDAGGTIQVSKIIPEIKGEIKA